MPDILYLTRTSLESAATTSATPPRMRHLAALLIVVLLFAQWAGWQHRVAHANWGALSGTFANNAAETGQVDWHVDAQQYQGEKSHSCLLFDAATLGCAAPTIVFTLPLQTSAKVIALWLAFSSWDAPLLRVFSPRAPPRQ